MALLIASDGTIRWATAGIDRMCLTETGVLGVGTMTPTANGDPIAHFVTPHLAKDDPEDSGKDVVVFGTNDLIESLAVSIGVRQSPVGANRFGFINAFELGLAARPLIFQNLGGAPVGIGNFNGGPPDAATMLHVHGVARATCLWADDAIIAPRIGVNMAPGDTPASRIDVICNDQGIADGIRLVRGDDNPDEFGVINLDAGYFNFIASLAEVAMHGVYSWRSYNGTATKLLALLDGESGNLGLGVTAWGQGATKTIAIGVGTEPGSSPPDMVQVGAVDVAAGRTTLSLRTEEQVAADIGLATTHSLIIRHNGQSFKLHMTAI